VEVDPLDLPEHAGGVALLPLLDLVVERLGHRVAPFEDRSDRGVEPPVHRSLEQLGGDGEQEQHGDQRQADVGGDQLELERRAEHPVPALDQQLDQIAQQDEEDDQDQDDVGVPEDEQQDPVGHQGRGQVAPALDEIEKSGGDQQQEDQPAADQAVVLAMASELRAQAHGSLSPVSFPESQGMPGGRNFGDSLQSVLMVTGMTDSIVREPSSASTFTNRRHSLGRPATEKTGRFSMWVIASSRPLRSRTVRLSISLSSSL
jgi:hypothetical protein